MGIRTCVFTFSFLYCSLDDVNLKILLDFRLQPIGKFTQILMHIYKWVGRYIYRRPQPSNSYE